MSADSETTRQQRSGTAVAEQERPEAAPGTPPGAAPGAAPGAGTPQQPGPGQPSGPVQWVPVVPAQNAAPTTAQPPGQPQTPERVPWHRQGWFWLIVVVVALGVITILGIAVVGALHGLLAQGQAQTAAVQKQTETLGGMAAALQGIQQSLQGIGQALQAISRELAQLVGAASAHTASSAGPGASAASALH